MELQPNITNRASKISLLILALLLALLAVAIGRGLGVPLSDPTNSLDRTSEQNQPAVKHREADFLSETWHNGADGHASAETEQRDKGVPLLIYFYTDWCPYCKKFDQAMLPSREVAEFMKSVIKVRINPEAGPDELAIANRYGVHGYPSIFVVPVSGSIPKKIYPFKKVGQSFEAVEPSQFVNACREAGLP